MAFYRLRLRRVTAILFLVVLFYLTFRRLPYDSVSPIQTQYSKPPIPFRKATFDWSTIPHHYPVSSLTPLPREKPKHLPRVQHEFASYTQDPATEARRNAVKDAFVRSWNSYKRHAWLHDELKPVSGGAKDNYGGWAATMVDALDTLWIMGLRDEFRDAATAAAAIDWHNTTESGINLFETTIRHLGGLLSAYDLSGEPALLSKARELGEMLYHAFDTPNRLPGFWLTFEDARAGLQLAGTHDPSSAPTSLSLEFTRLAQLTGDDKFYDAIERLRAFLERTQEESLLPGLWPTMINFREQSVEGKSTSRSARWPTRCTSICPRCISCSVAWTRPTRTPKCTAAPWTLS